MPSQNDPDDEETQEGNEPSGYRPAGRADAASAASTPPATPSADWSSQQPAGSSWQPPSTSEGPGQAWQQPRGQWQAPYQGQWQQPAQGQWAQPPSEMWQQPPQWSPQQGWGAAGYWAPVPQYGNNPLVITAGILLILFGAIVTLLGLIGTMAGMMMSALLEDIMPRDVAADIDIAALSNVIVAVMVVVLVLGILHIVSAIGIFMHKGWGRVLGAIFGVLGTLVGVLTVAAALQPARPDSGDLVIAFVVLGGYALALFALIAGGNHFTRRYLR